MNLADPKPSYLALFKYVRGVIKGDTRNAANTCDDIHAQQSQSQDTLEVGANGAPRSRRSELA